MADTEFTPAEPKDFFCPAGGTWYVEDMDAVQG